MQLHPLPQSSPSRCLRTVFGLDLQQIPNCCYCCCSNPRSISPLHLLLQQPSPGSLARKSASHPCHGRTDMADASDVHCYDQSWHDMDFTSCFLSLFRLFIPPPPVPKHHINIYEVSFLRSSLGPPGFRIVARTGSANIRTWSKPRIA